MQALDTASVLTLDKHSTSNTYLLVDVAYYQGEEAYLCNLENGANCEPLFVGTPYQTLNRVSPKLIQLNPAHEALVADVQKRLAGIILTSEFDIKTVTTNIQHQLTAQSTSMGKVYLRFYTPGVSRALITGKTKPHGWKDCLSIMLPTYSRTHWQPFQLNHAEHQSALHIDEVIELDLQIERMAYYLGIRPLWKASHPSTTRSAAKALVELSCDQSLTTKQFKKWEQFLLSNQQVVESRQWQTLVEKALPEPQVWDKAQFIATHLNTQSENDYV